MIMPQKYRFSLPQITTLKQGDLAMGPRCCMMTFLAVGICSYVPKPLPKSQDVRSHTDVDDKCLFKGLRQLKILGAGLAMS